jgi:hypothetical protein
VAKAAFCSLIGTTAFVTPWVWRGVLALARGGLATAIILSFNARREPADLRPLGHAARDIGAGVWRRVLCGGRLDHRFRAFQLTARGVTDGHRAMTIAFGVGQTLGPIVVGAISDALGSVAYALNVSAALLAAAAAFQGKLRKTSLGRQRRAFAPCPPTSVKAVGTLRFAHHK